jgi:hypothetical protein
MPFESPEALLSVTHPHDILFTAQVQLSGAELVSHLHDLLHTVTRGIAIDTEYCHSGIALEVLVPNRHELALHTAHVDGLTRLLRRRRHHRGPKHAGCSVRTWAVRCSQRRRG